MSKILDLIV